MVTVREARRGEEDTVLALNQELFDYERTLDPTLKFDDAAREHFRGIISSALTQEDTRLVVAVDDGRIVGFMIGWLYKKTPLFTDRLRGFVGHGFVKEEYRRRGVARALLSDLEAWFKGKGVERVEIDAYAANTQAVEAWRALGFAEYMRNMIKKL